MVLAFFCFGLILGAIMAAWARPVDHTLQADYDDLYNDYQAYIRILASESQRANKAEQEVEWLTAERDGLLTFIGRCAHAQAGGK